MRRTSWIWSSIWKTRCSTDFKMKIMSTSALCLLVRYNAKFNRFSIVLFLIIFQYVLLTLPLAKGRRKYKNFYLLLYLFQVSETESWISFTCKICSRKISSSLEKTVSSTTTTIPSSRYRNYKMHTVHMQNGILALTEKLKIEGVVLNCTRAPQFYLFPE